MWIRACFRPRVMRYNCRTMEHSTNDADNRMTLRWGRMASCLERLLEPEFSAAEIGHIIAHAIPADSRLPGRELLPRTNFNTENQANALWERVALSLINDGIGPVNVRTDVDGVFEELALNAAQHSRSPGGCYATVEMDQPQDVIESGGENIYVIGISDGGIGIPESLRANPLYADISSDKDAILRATEMDVSGTAEQRGAGLYHVMERVRAYQGELLIIAGYGLLTVHNGGEPSVSDLRDLDGIYRHGTTVMVALPFPAE